MPKIKVSQILFLVLLLFNVGLAVCYLSQKQGWHVDEQYTYGTANSTEGAYLGKHVNSFHEDPFDEVHNHWKKGKDFHDYLTVQNNEKFDYKNIKENLKISVHPPLYFWLLHTICSLTPDVFSKWQAGSINIVAFLLLLLMFYKLSKLFINDEYMAMVPVFLWGFSEVGLATVLFLRMYTLQTLFTVCLLYEVSKMLIENVADKKRLFLIFLYATLGNLTQFSSLVFAFILTAVSDTVLLWRKNWKMLVLFSAMMLLSVAALVALFPETLSILLYSKDGAEIHARFSGVKWLHLLFYFLYGNQSVFGVYAYYLFHVESKYFILVLLALALMVIRQKEKKTSSAFGVLIAVIILLTFYLAIFMPKNNMGGVRYYMLLMPVAALLTVSLAEKLLKALKLSSQLTAGICFVLVFILSVNVCWRKCPYSVSLTEETLALTEKLENKNIMVRSQNRPFNDAIHVYTKAKKVYLADTETNAPIEQALNEADYVLVFNNYPFDKSFFAAVKVRPLESAMVNRVRYVSPFRVGIVNFDLYEVIK